MTARQAALALGVRPQTLKNCLLAARRALGAPNTLAAVVAALKCGEIDLDEIEICTSHDSSEYE